MNASSLRTKRSRDGDDSVASGVSSVGMPDMSGLSSSQRGRYFHKLEGYIATHPSLDTAELVRAAASQPTAEWVILLSCMTKGAMGKVQESSKQDKESNDRRIKNKKDESEAHQADVDVYQVTTDNLRNEHFVVTEKLAQSEANLATSISCREAANRDVRVATLENHVHEFIIQFAQYCINKPDEIKVFGKPGVTLAQVRAKVGVSIWAATVMATATAVTTYFIN